MPRSVLAPLVALTLLGACSSLEALDRPREPQGLQGLLGPSGTGDALTAIARLEDARQDGGGLLEILVGRGSDPVRERAALALGRLPAAIHGAAVTAALTSALDDESPRVRSAAAFALGQRGDISAAGPLLAHWDDPDVGVRAALVEAAGKLDDPRLREEVLYALSDREERVRVEAVTAPHRWPTDDPSAAEVDTALVHLLERALEANAGRGDASRWSDQEVVWRALFSLQRRAAERGRAVFLAFATGTAPVDARIFAIKGLARIAPDEASRVALERALADSDWRVACEAALGLGAAADPRSIEALAGVLEHRSTHVRVCAYEALGAFASERDTVAGLLEKARVDRSPAVRATALVAEAKVRGREVVADLEVKRAERDPIVRAGVAEAAAELPSLEALPLLLALTHDEDPRVAGLALEGLGRHLLPQARERLHAALHEPDNGHRLAACLALREAGDPSDLPHLRAAFETSEGDVAAEVRAECLRNAASIPGDASAELLALGLAAPEPYVRSLARTLLEARGLPAPESDAPLAAPEPLTERPWADLARNPTAEIRTTRGVMSFELFADEAPLHVENFVQLARRGFYEGLDFHRVVPDFVIQGGCYRGDGNGGTTWRGGSLRQEIGPRKFVRGSLGMPRNDDLESGGSQLFVTHRPTPHLDGRYTIFGELRSGFEVLDATELGDTIVDVRIR